MMEHFDVLSFRQQLLDWYHSHKRTLPWRDTTDFYKIWISEIILQQTQVAQGYDYFVRFLKKFPTVTDLAIATEQEVLTQWQGLGYYTRAINLHKAAKQIVFERKGVFPKTYDEILQLKGVGPYTASAISSFAYKLPHAVVDGNVMRVLSRLLDVDIPVNTTKGRAMIDALANELLDKKQPDIYNQAIMEFGALQCRPQNPDCEQCVLKKECNAYAHKTVADRPQKIKKKKQEVRYFTYLVVKTPRGYLMQQRDDRHIFKNMYEFLLLDERKSYPLVEIRDRFIKKYPFLKEYLTGAIVTMSKPQKHILSHITIQYRYAVVMVQKNIFPKNMVVVPINKFKDYPVYRIVEKIIELQNEES